MDRRGSIAGYVVFLILAVVVLLVLLSFQTRILGSYDARSSREDCASQVRVNAALRLKDAEFSGSIRCEPMYYELPSSDKSIPVLAYEMADCWRTFGRGELELFSGEGIFCVPCGVVVFDKPGTRLAGFGDYLSTKEVPATFGRGTYLDFLSSYSTDGLGARYEKLSLQERQALDPVLDTSEPYGVLFVMARGLDGIGRVKQAFGGPVKTSVGVGTASGAGAVLIAVAAGASLPVSATVGGLAALGVGIYTFFAGKDPEWMAFTTLVPYTEESLSALGCAYAPVRLK